MKWRSTTHVINGSANASNPKFIAVVCSAVLCDCQCWSSIKDNNEQRIGFYFLNFFSIVFQFSFLAGMASFLPKGTSRSKQSHFWPRQDKLKQEFILTLVT